MITPPLARRLALTTAVLLSLGLASAAGAQGKLLSLSKQGNTLHVYDARSFEPLGEYEVGAGPHEVVTDATGRYAYVANYGHQQPGNSFTVIDLQEKKLVTTIDLGPLKRPHGLAERDGKIYFTAELAKAVARVDTKTNKVDWIAGTGRGITHMLALSPATGEIFTADITGGTVTAIDPAAPPPASVTVIDVPGQPEGIAVSPDGAFVAVGDNQGGDITIIDAKTKQVVDTIEAEGMPIRVGFTADGRRLLTTDPQAGMLRVYDFAQREKTGEVAVGEGPVGFVLSKEGTALVSLTGENAIVEVDLETMELKRRLETGPVPDGIALVDNGARDAQAAAGEEAEDEPARPAPPRAQQPAEPAQPGGRPRLGVALDMTAEGGIEIIEVTEDTPAEAAGLRAGDLITHLDGEPLEDPQQLVRAVIEAREGQMLTLTIRRGEEMREVKVTL